MRKKLLIIIGIVMFIYAVIFAIIISGTIILPSYVYENEKLIASKLNTANKINYHRGVQNGITTVTCGKMTGMDVIWKYDTSEDVSMQMCYTLQVTSGKAKLILIRSDNTNSTLVEQDSSTEETTVSDTTSATEQQCTLDLKKGRNKIKIVCEKGTSFALSFQISEMNAHQ